MLPMKKMCIRDSDKAEAEQQKQLLVQEKNTIKGQINALNDQIEMCIRDSARSCATARASC